MPDHLLGIHRLAVNNGGDLPVGTTGVEADAAAVEMAADPPGAAARLREVRLRHGLQQEGTLEHRLHEVHVEFPGAAAAIDIPQRRCQSVAAADVDVPAAHAPQQQLDGALQEP